MLEQLGDRHPFIDLERLGIYGHSGGGFMSTAAMLVCEFPWLRRMWPGLDRLSALLPSLAVRPRVAKALDRLFDS